MTTYSATDTPPVNCHTFAQTNNSPIRASFPCGCVVDDIKPSLLKTWYQCKCGRHKFYVKAECVVWNEQEEEIDNTIRQVDYMLRNECHMKPWVRRMKMIIDIALTPKHW